MIADAELLPLQQLKQAAGQLIVDGLRSSSQRTYSHGQKLFLTFCGVYGLQALPATEDTLMLFVTYMFTSRHLKHDTIHVYLYSVRSMHIEQSYDNPLNDCPRLNRVFRAVKLQQGDSTRRKLGFTLELLTRVYQQNPPKDHDSLVLWSAMTMAHFGLLRCAEFTVNSSLGFDAEIHVCVRGRCHD